MHQESRASAWFPDASTSSPGTGGAGLGSRGKAFEDLREELIHRLGNLPTPQTGVPLVVRVWRREELYQGPPFQHGGRISWWCQVPSTSGPPGRSRAPAAPDMPASTPPGRLPASGRHQDSPRPGGRPTHGRGPHHAQAPGGPGPARDGRPRPALGGRRQLRSGTLPAGIGKAASTKRLAKRVIARARRSPGERPRPAQRPALPPAPGPAGRGGLGGGTMGAPLGGAVVISLGVAT